VGYNSRWANTGSTLTGCKLMQIKKKKKVKLSCAMGGVNAYVHIFFTPVLVGEWSSSRPDRLTPGERTANTHCRGESVGLRARLDDVDLP
jgi:hypothetical protein